MSKTIYPDFLFYKHEMKAFLAKYGEQPRHSLIRTVFGIRLITITVVMVFLVELVLGDKVPWLLIIVATILIIICIWLLADEQRYLKRCSLVIKGYVAGGGYVVDSGSRSIVFTKSTDRIILLVNIVRLVSLLLIEIIPLLVGFKMLGVLGLLLPNLFAIPIEKKARKKWSTVLFNHNDDTLLIGVIKFDQALFRTYKISEDEENTYYFYNDGVCFAKATLPPEIISELEIR